MTPETLAEAILQAAGSSLRHYTPQSRERILDAARVQIAELQGVPVSVGVLHMPADPRNIAQDGRSGAVATLASSGVENGPHGAEMRGDE